MIKIFNANDKDFTTAGNIIIEPTKCLETHKKSLNGWYIEVEIPIKYKEYIEKDKLCVVPTKSKLKPQAFRISENIEYTNRKIKFTANHVMFDSKDYILVDVRPTNQNGINALNYINERTDNTSPFKMFSNVENVNTAYFIRKNLLEAWTTIEERWNGVFDADNWDISFLRKVGNDNGESVIYGKNMQSMEIYEDWSSVCTRIYPVGYDGITLPEEFLESDIQYEKPYSRVIDFQTDLESGEQTEDKLIEELRKNAQKYIEENKYPKTSYTIVSNINDRMEIGDTISVLHPLVTIKTEVLEYQYDIISKKVKSLTFGNYSRDVKAKFDNIKSSINEVTQTLSKQELVIKQQTDLINSLNKTGYVYIDENEILILDKLPKQTAKNVWRFGLGGLGFSSNGYEGPFEIAITIDGQINAKFITTGTMSVARIEGLQNSLNDLLVQIQLNSDNIQSIVETQNSIKKQFDNYYTIEKVNSAITQKADSITSEVNKSISTAKQEAIDSANSSTDNKLKNYTKTVDMNSKIEQTAENITSEVSKTYSTKDETNEAKQEAIDSANSSTDNKLKNYSTTTQINSAITQKANEITTSVSSTYETKTNVDTKINSAKSEMKQTTDSIETEVSKKAGNDEVCSIVSQSAEEIHFEGNRVTIKADNLTVNKDGTITCKNAQITGNITATSGKIGNFEIKNGWLQVDKDNVRTVVSDKGFGIWKIAGNVAGYDVLTEIFTVEFDGKNTQLNLGGISGGIGTLIADIYKVNGAGRVMFGMTAEHDYICHWTGSQLQFWVDETNVGTLSDKRLKKDIKNIDDKFIQAIEEIEMKQFKVANRNGLISFGILAQDLIEIFKKYNISPFDYEIVYQTQYRTDDDTIYYAINYEQFLILKAKAQELEINQLQEKDKQKDKTIQDLIKRIENLEKGVKSEKN